MKIIITLLIIILLVIGAVYYLRIDSKYCWLKIDNEKREVCFVVSAMEKDDSTLCSNLKEEYRKKRCTELVQSDDQAQRESVLESLKKYSL